MARSSFDRPKRPASSKHFDEVVDDQLTAVITLREVYDAVVSLKEELNGVPTITADHETRIRDLERKVWSYSGIAAIAGAALAQIVTYLLK